MGDLVDMSISKGRRGDRRQQHVMYQLLALTLRHLITTVDEYEHESKAMVIVIKVFMCFSDSNSKSLHNVSVYIV